MLSTEARTLAMGYVWGIQDERKGKRDSLIASLFGDAFAARNEAFNREATWSMVPVSIAWNEWRDDGHLTYETGPHDQRVWREIVTEMAHGTARIVDRVLVP